MKNAVNKIQKNLYLVLCMLFYSLIITAQNGTIAKGVVLDENNEPVIGATISIKGNKSIGTIADIDGKFQLKVPNADAVLVISFIGMTPQEVKIGKQPIRVILKSDNVQLEEVVERAKRYLGCNEKDGSFKKIIDSYNKLDPLPRGYKVKYTDSWCMTFVSAIVRECNLLDIIPVECSCGKAVEKAQSMGIWQENDAYVPQIGDL